MTLLSDFIETYRVRVNTALERWLPTAGDSPARLHEAMRYSTLGEGKRLRPILVYATAAATGVEPQTVDAPACAVELIHTYSLVHDDLPAMDDDDLRRGRATCHRAFDEATAVLVGDALQVLAFEILASDETLMVAPERRMQMVAELASASGTRGMAGGQAIDLAAMGNALDLSQLEHMHRLKTGALICSSVRLGALASPSLAPDQLETLTRYADHIGLAFQIRDDILDEEGDAATIGKTPGSDRASDKPTYTSMLGIPEARRRSQQQCEAALACLGDFGPEADLLRSIARYIVDRRR